MDEGGGTVRACEVSQMLRLIHAGALMAMSVALSFNTKLFETEGIYQPLSTVGSTTQWGVVMCLFSFLMAAANLTPRRFRIAVDIVAAILWSSVATLIGGMSGVNMGTGIYGYMFFLSMAGFASEMLAWLDDSKNGKRVMTHVRRAGDRRMGKL